MPRMVVLWHDVTAGDKFERGSHFDLMLEVGGVLWTWAVEQWPLENGEAVAAKQLADHRLAYLEYEGAISGGRGTVTRVDQGEYWLLDSTAERIGFELASRQCDGRFVIELGKLSRLE